MNWNARVERALRDPRIRDGIAKAIASYAKRHIANSVGRGENGSETALAPLKPLSARFWTRRKPPQGAIPLQTRTVKVIKTVKRKNGQTVTKTVDVTEYLMEGSSYRDGGKPLRDTGNLQRSLSARAALSGPKRVSVTVSGALYGIFHELGFETSGPNFIPLTRKGKREHATGRNPNAEGLARGRDFIMAWGGVTVPKRPFLVPTGKEWSDIARTIRMGLARVLKGRT